MSIRALLASCALLLMPPAAMAERWSSPDGVLSVEAPDAATFESLPESPPPLLVLWISGDETMRFGVTKLDIPPGINLNQSSAEEGLAEEVGGKVERLPTRTVSGHEVWGMKATSESAEITQWMLRHENAVYKLMAITMGAEADADAINKFFESLEIAAQTAVQQQSPAESADEGVDTHQLSKTIGGVAAVLLIVLLIYAQTRGKKQTS